MTEPMRVKFPLADDPAGYSAEWMWAEPLRDSTFKLDSSPFSAYGISADDIFQVLVIDDILVFDKIIRKSGNRTVRVRLPKGFSHDNFLPEWSRLEQLGCTFEGSQAGRPLYSITVPPDTEIGAVLAYLKMKEDAGVWEFEEADT